MAARDKLEEAEYFLKELHKTRPDQKEFIFKLNAFLSSARSVPDYLLEDYNVKFSLQIPLTVKLYPDTFENRAIDMGNQTALSFIEWWKQKMAVLANDPIWALLTDKRHINVHRIQTKLDLVKIEIEETVHISESIRIGKYDKEGRLIEIYESPKEELPKPKETEVKINWFFKEYDKEPVIPICEKYLDKIKKFVEEAERKFP